jgi:hypothetical protein
LAPSEPGQPDFDLGSQTATVVTIVHDQAHNAVTEVGFNETYHANVMVSAGGPTPTGTVTFTEYDDSQCTNLRFELAPVAIDGTGAAESGTFSIGGPANVSFKTHYSGDANYAAADSNCAPISVVGMLPVIAVEAHNSSHQSVTTVPLNKAVHVKANISGSGPTPTGTITRVWWSNGTCSGTPTATEGSMGLVGGNGDIAHRRPAEAIPLLRAALHGTLDNVQLYVTRTELHELLAQAYAAQQQSDSAAVHCRHVAAALANADPQARPRFQRAVQAVSARRN